MVTINELSRSDLHDRVSRRMVLAGMPSFRLHEPMRWHERAELWGELDGTGVKVDLTDYGKAAAPDQFEFICYDPVSGVSLGSPSTGVSVAAALDAYDWSTMRSFVDLSRQAGPQS